MTRNFFIFHSACRVSKHLLIVFAVSMLFNKVGLLSPILFLAVTLKSYGVPISRCGTVKVVRGVSPISSHSSSLAPAGRLNTPYAVTGEPLSSVGAFQASFTDSGLISVARKFSGLDGTSTIWYSN